MTQQTKLFHWLQTNDVSKICQRTAILYKRKQAKQQRYPPMHIEEFTFITNDVSKVTRLTVAQRKNMVENGIEIPTVLDVQVL